MSQNGSWECPNCTLQNSLDNLNCATCLAKRPLLRGRGTDEDPLNEQTGPASRSRATRVLRRWQCLRCSSVNNSSVDACENCGSNRTNGMQQSIESLWKDFRGWVKEKWPSAFGPSDRQWSCPNCTLHNSPDSVQCCACGCPYGLDVELRGNNFLFSDQGSPLQPRPAPDHHPPPSRGGPGAHVSGDGPTSSLSCQTTRIADERKKQRCDASVVYERVCQYQREVRV